MKTIAQLMYDEWSAERGLGCWPLDCDTFDFLSRNEEIDDAEVLEQSYIEFMDDFDLLELRAKFRDVNRHQDELPILYAYEMEFINLVKKIQNRTENNQTEKEFLEELDETINHYREKSIELTPECCHKDDELDADRVKDGLLTDDNADFDNYQMIKGITDELVDEINEGNITSEKEMLNKWIGMVDETAKEITDKIRLLELWHYSVPDALTAYENYERY